MWFNICQLWTWLLAFVIMCIASLCHGVEHLVYTFTNQVGAGNFTYFKLHRDGNVRLELKSVSGDADLYVSSKTLSPDYNSYEFSSTTCGEDEVLVPAKTQRPVGVGVFGHPSYEVSHLILSVYFSYDESEVETVKLEDDTSTRRAFPPQNPVDTDHQESLLWSIFVGLLKIILDILV